MGQERTGRAARTVGAIGAIRMYTTSASRSLVNVSSKNGPRATRTAMHSSTATRSFVDIASEHWTRPILHATPATRSVVDALQNRAWPIEGVERRQIVRSR